MNNLSDHYKYAFHLYTLMNKNYTLVIKEIFDIGILEKIHF